MKKSFYSIVFLLFAINGAVYAQKSDEKSVFKDEISVSTNNLNFNNLSLKYARLISKATWLKLGVIDLSGSSHKNMPLVGSFNKTNSKFNGGLLIGIDKQRTLSSKLEMIYGLNVQMTYSYSNFKPEDPSVAMSKLENKVHSYSPGIGFGLGCFYKINSSVLIGVELNPSVNYSFLNSNNSYSSLPFKNKGFDFSITNNAALITLKYRI